MKTSENISNLTTALAAAQAKMKPAKMNAFNPFLKNKYADLGSIVDVIQSLLAEQGLSYVQMPSMTDGERIGIALTTRLMHNSGEWLEDTFFMPMPASEPGKSLMQVAGSAITYARRYALSAMLSVVSDEDMDGNMTQVAKKPAVATKPAPVKPAVVAAVASTTAPNAAATVSTKVAPALTENGGGESEQHNKGMPSANPPGLEEVLAELVPAIFPDRLALVSAFNNLRVKWDSAKREPIVESLTRYAESQKRLAAGRSRQGKKK